MDKEQPKRMDTTLDRPLSEMAQALPDFRWVKPSNAVASCDADQVHAALSQESQLIADAMRGNVEACHRIYMLHSGSVAATIHGVVRNHHDTEEILQDTMVKAFSRLRDFRGAGTLEGWLKRIAINEALMFLRRRKRFTAMDNDTIQAVQDKNPPVGRGADSDVSANDLQNRLTAAIDTLPGELREAFVLGAIEQRHYRDVGEMLGISIELVKVRVHRARHILKSELKEYLT